MHYDKIPIADAIDFAIVSVTSMYSVEKDRFTGARIVWEEWRRYRSECRKGRIPVGQERYGSRGGGAAAKSP
jgi:hypothetical protein